MAHLSNIPNEIVSEIWSHIHEPGDVESFALVSKHIYDIGRPYVEEHNKLKKDFSLSKIGAEINTSAPAFLLKEVLCRPRVALYVTHLSIGRCLRRWRYLGDDDDNDEETNDDGDDDEWPNSDHVSYPDYVMALFIEATRKSTFVPPDQVPHWIAAIEAGNEDPILALLSMLLPNLIEVTLTIPEGGFSEIYLPVTSQRIAMAKQTMFLRRLVAANIVIASYEESQLNFFWWMEVFAALPLVQSLHFSQIIDAEDALVVHENDETEYLISDGYNITEMTFTNCSLGPTLLFRLLELFKGLKVFSYNEPNDTYCKLEPLWIRTALLANSQHSLERLKIMLLQTQKHKILGGLHRFIALKELETNVCIFDAYLGPWTSSDVAKLLPASLEKLHLHICNCHLDRLVPRLVEGVIKAKSQLISDLKALKLELEPGSGIMQEGRSLIEPLEEECRNVGIELAFIENPGKRIGCNWRVEGRNWKEWGGWSKD